METQPTISVANYFISKAQHDGDQITPMKLLKLVYIAHGWALGLYGVPLIAEEVQAWKYGPVVPSVYEDFKHYGRNPIERQKAVYAPGDEQLRVPTVADLDTQRLLDSVWAAYRRFNGLQLSDITHQPGTPWDLTWNQERGCDRMGAVIRPDVIQAHYRQLAESRR